MTVSEFLRIDVSGDDGTDTTQRTTIPAIMVGASIAGSFSTLQPRYSRPGCGPEPRQEATRRNATRRGADS